MSAASAVGLVMLSVSTVLSLACGGVAPARPAGANEDAVWVGGDKGGAWIACDKADDGDGRYSCTVYNETTGKVSARGEFVVRILKPDGLRGYWEPGDELVPLAYKSWNGIVIVLEPPYVLVPDGWLDYPLGDNLGKRQRYQDGAPVSEAYRYETELRDRTAATSAKFDKHLKMFGLNPYGDETHGYGLPPDRFDVPKDKIDMALHAASAWAVDNCYLPCAFTMGGSVLVIPERDYLAVYISPIEPEVGIGPEAFVYVDSTDFRIVDSVKIHSPCRGYAERIGWFRDTCRPFNHRKDMTSNTYKPPGCQ